MVDHHVEEVLAQKVRPVAVDVRALPKGLFHQMRPHTEMFVVGVVFLNLDDTRDDVACTSQTVVIVCVEEGDGIAEGVSCGVRISVTGIPVVAVSAPEPLLYQALFGIIVLPLALYLRSAPP